MIDDQQLAHLAIDAKLIDAAGLHDARRRQQRHGGDLYTILLEHGLVDEERAITLVSKAMNIPCVSLKDFEPDPAIIAMLPASMAAQHRVIPLGVVGEGSGSLYLAMVNPIDVDALEAIGQHTGLDVMSFLAGPLDIDRTLEKCYGRAIYRQHIPANDFLTGGVGARDPFAGPSMSQLMDLPILDDVRSDGLTHAVSGPAGVPPGPRPAFSPPAMLDSVDLQQMGDAEEEDHDMLEVDIEGFGDPQASELFGVRGSRIFMPPESLTAEGRQRLAEASRINGALPPPSQQAEGSSTQMGHWKLESEDGSIALDEPSSLVPHGVISEGAEQMRPSSADPFPRELTDRSIRVLNHAFMAHSTEEVLGAADPGELVRAVIRLMLRRGLIDEADLLREIARDLQREDS